MSLKARYVTQTSVYDNPRLGPLTDRRIKHYQKLGYYGEAAKKRALERQEVKRKKILIEFLA